MKILSVTNVLSYISASCKRPPKKLTTLCFVLLVLFLSTVAQARSTFTARFAKEAIAGPGQVREAILYLHYFAGDGEAVVRTELVCEAADVADILMSNSVHPILD